jgi:hypothetical protein
MYRLAIFERYDAQHSSIPLLYDTPPADPSVGLKLPPDRVAKDSLAPLAPDVRAFP